MRLVLVIREHVVDHLILYLVEGGEPLIRQAVLEPVHPGAASGGVVGGGAVASGVVAGGVVGGAVVGGAVVGGAVAIGAVGVVQ